MCRLWMSEILKVGGVKLDPKDCTATCALCVSR